MRILPVGRGWTIAAWQDGRAWMSDHGSDEETRTAVRWNNREQKMANSLIERGVCYCLLPNPKKAVFERFRQSEKWLFKFLQHVRLKVKKIAKSVCYRVCY